MFQGLKIAVKQQKKLLVFFFITIFLPSVSLSIFGIIALRNEKFRLEKQIENEQLQIAASIKGKIETKLADIGERLKNLANYLSFRQKDYPVIKELLIEVFEKDSLSGIVFLLYRNAEPLFPLFQTGFEENVSTSVVTHDNSLQQQIKNAEGAEYIWNDYLMAVSIYNDAFLKSNNHTLKGRLLNLIARNLMKADKFSEAADVYSKIINDYPDERTIVDPETGIKYTKIRIFVGKNDVINDIGGIHLSPDGRFVVLENKVVPLNGSDPFDLVDMKALRATYASGMKKAAFFADSAIWIVPVSPETGRANGKPEKLLSGGYNYQHPVSWSPDGEKIAFVRMDKTITEDIWTLSLSDRKLLPVTDSPGLEHYPAWSPDGKTIAYLKERGL